DRRSGFVFSEIGVDMVASLDFQAPGSLTLGNLNHCLQLGSWGGLCDCSRTAVKRKIPDLVVQPHEYNNTLSLKQLSGVNPVRLLAERTEAAGQIVRQRCGVIEGARMQPHALGAGGPGLLRRDREEVLAQPAPLELGQQAEVCDLDRAVT